MSFDRVLIGPSEAPVVVLRDPRPDLDGWSRFVVELHADGLDVVKGVEVHHMHHFPSFLKGLAAEWRGWQGEQRWRSTEPGLDIVARHDGGHIQMVWTAVDGSEQIWSASVAVVIEPGERLAGLARDASALFADL